MWTNLRALLSIASAVSFVALSACSKETLTRRSPAIKITPKPSDHYHIDVENLAIDLGEVPVFVTAKAVFIVENPTERPLDITGVNYDADRTSGERWLDAEFPATIAPFSKKELAVPYAPAQVGRSDIAVLVVSSNAAQDPNVEITVRGTGVYLGAPDIDLTQGSTVELGPLAGDCVDVDTDGQIDGCAIPDTRALNVGNVALGTQGSTVVYLRNRAECPPFPGADPCSSCELWVERGARNIGFGWKPANPTDPTDRPDLFSIGGNIPDNFTLRQAGSNGCNEDGFVPIAVQFTAPSTEAAYHATLVIESNDPDEPVVELPVRAAARNAPVAIAKFRAFDPANPTEYTDPNNIEPLTRVYFDGSASYDPSNPTDPSLIASYRWEVLSYPSGANPADFQLQGLNSAYFSFWVPIATGTGEPYVVRLTVTNVDGVESGDTADARKEFFVVPGSRLHVQLTWDNPSNDQDLHLTNMNVPTCQTAGCLCSRTNDCYFSNCSTSWSSASLPRWFTSGPAGAGPNPTLDIDDTTGLGPENINIDSPEPGTYRVYVHYYTDAAESDASPTRNTVRIFLDGLQVAEYRRTLTPETVWAVADIMWSPTGGTAVGIASDNGTDPGRVRSYTQNQCSASDGGGL